MSEPGKSPRQFSSAFKEGIVLRLEAGEKIAAVAEETEVRRKLFYQWRDAYRSMGTAGFNCRRGRKPGTTRGRAFSGVAPSIPSSVSDVGPSAATPENALARAEARIGELERVIGRQQTDLHFFREALRLWDATSPSGGAPISTRSSKK
jgi:transposase-like protein